MALRPLEIGRPPDEVGGGEYGSHPQYTQKDTAHGETQSRTTQNTAQMACKGLAEPLVCIRQARPAKTLQSLTEPYKAKFRELHKKIAIAFISLFTRNPAQAFSFLQTSQIIRRLEPNGQRLNPNVAR
jgi:hypothetical protein